MSPGLREQKKARLKREIFVAAVGLFRKTGFDETRVRDVCDAVGISWKTFFNYYPSKDAILDELVLRLLDGWEERLQDALAEDRTPVPERVRALARDLVDAPSQDPQFMLTIFTRSKLFAADDGLRERELEIYAVFAELFRRGQERGEIRSDVEADVLAESFTALHYLTTMNWLARWWDQPGDLRERFGKAIEVFLDGAAPRKPSRKRARAPKEG